MPQFILPDPRLYPSFESGLNTNLIVTRSSSDTPPDFFNVSQALFACLSAVIGLLALIIGVLQLQRYRGRHSLHEEDPIFELEAGYPTVGTACICFMNKYI
jgi:hypothetical protein